MSHSRAASISLILFLAGCGDKPAANHTPAATETNPPPGRSTVHTLIGGFTGQTAIEKGKEARATLEAIGKKEKADMDEVLP